MNWDIGLMVFLAVVLVTEIPKIVKFKSARDMTAFLLVWGLATVALIANWLEWPYLRPLDWVKAVTGLLTG
ncbi:hypothetical protein [Paenibacillus sp. JDR-2]|uniref:hypothetical protein n=1 Tax=Paenibacillus sp. (strain JDR-2) TaxID=324057 RepID=UPI0001665A70|nr:hypothetical protein [Paenibacillus sp. JDR-2]ACT01722.1 hypothetical protein Pjdr2_3077 [Paenibacillus sp. JDR-2]